MAIVNSDYTVIQGITLILAVSVGFAVLIIDLIYPRLDPLGDVRGRVRAYENSNVTRNYVVQRQIDPLGAWYAG